MNNRPLPGYGSALWATLVLGFLVACSGNMTGGATPPVAPVAPGGPGGTTGLVPQGMAAPGAMGVATPIPGASAQVPITSSATPLPLPNVAGYGGSIILVAATPLPSDDPMLGVTLQPAPQNAPLRSPAPKKGAIHPLVTLELRSEVGAATLVKGLAGLSFALPLDAYKGAKHFALALYDQELPAQPHALFRRKKVATRTTLALDEKTQIDKAGHTMSGVTLPLTLLATHQYMAILYADQPLPGLTPGPMPNSMPSSVPNAMSSVAASSVPTSLVSPLPSSAVPASSATPWLASTPRS